MSLDILLATYNGEAYLPELLSSLLTQTDQNWKLLVRDDGSSDATLAIIEDYKPRFGERLHLVKSHKTRLGAIQNFAALLEASSAEYIMFCDQDDVWMEDKIARTRSAMHELETQYTMFVPLLVHTDATIVDQTLTPIGASFAQHHRSQPLHSSFSRLLVQNMVHGCTVMANRTLVNSALPLPPAVRMHDMWLALIASSLGAIAYINQPTVYYRQHDNNVIGARKYSLKNIKAKTQEVMADNIAQAHAFHARFWGDLDSDKKNIIDAFLKLPLQSPSERHMIMWRYGFLRRPLWQNIPALLFS